MISSNLSIPADLERATTSPNRQYLKPSDNETPEQDDEEDGTKTTQTLEVHTTAIDNVDLSMMFIRPPLRGIGLDGAVLRGDTIEVRRLKRLLRERDLNDEGNDVAAERASSACPFRS